VVFRWIGHIRNYGLFRLPVAQRQPLVSSTLAAMHESINMGLPKVRLIEIEVPGSVWLSTQLAHELLGTLAVVGRQPALAPGGVPGAWGRILALVHGGRRPVGPEIDAHIRSERMQNLMSV
jgi:hypothetical protein